MARIVTAPKISMCWSVPQKTRSVAIRTKLSNQITSGFGSIPFQSRKTEPSGVPDAHVDDADSRRSTRAERTRTVRVSSGSPRICACRRMSPQALLRGCSAVRRGAIPRRTSSVLPVRRPSRSRLDRGRCILPADCVPAATAAIASLRACLMSGSCTSRLPMMVATCSESASTAAFCSSDFTSDASTGAETRAGFRSG